MRIANGLTVAVAAMGMMVGASTAMAAELYSSGTKTWDISTANWATNSGGPYTNAVWNSGTPDRAVFEGTAGTVN